MTDFKISKKLHFGLASRVVLIVSLLLVIPLLLQSVLLYRQEYRQKVVSTEAILLLVAQERVARIVADPEGSIESWTASDPASPYPIRFVISEKEVPANHSLMVEVPIPNTPLHLTASLPHSFIRSWHHSDFFYRLGTLLFCVGVLGGGAVIWLTRRISRPMRKLCSTLERVSEGAIHARYQPDWMGFEINQLGKQFNETLDQLLHHQREAEKERLLKERLAEELRIGHEIQKNLLPTHIPEDAGLLIAPGYLPAKEVSGDFYDLFLTPQGELLIVIADVAGKGVSACLHALGLRSAIRTLANTTPDLQEIVIRANDLFWLDAQHSSMFATLWIGLYDPIGKKLRYCSQGHPPAFLLQGGKMHELSTGGISVGAQQLDAVSMKEVVLAEGDLLCLYTDGITEAHDPDNQLFGKKRFTEFLFRKKKEMPAQIVDFLLEEVELFAQSIPQHDDMTLLICRCK